MEEKKYQIKNDAMVQGQVVGDYPQFHQHFYGTQAPSRLQSALLYEENVAQQLQDLFANFSNKYSMLIEELVISVEKVKSACENIRDSWSGSCIGYHSRLYYGDFARPPKGKKFSVEWGGIYGLSQGWDERTPEEVKTKIAQLVGNNFSIDKFEKDNEKLASEIEDFEAQIELLLSSIDVRDLQHPLVGIEKFELRKMLKSYINSSLSRSVMTRDSEAIAQGTIVPAIIYYTAVAVEAEAITDNIQKYAKAVERFIKWYKLQHTNVANSSSEPLRANLSCLHADIFNKCKDLFEAGAYAEAVEKSFKVVRDKLRVLTGYERGSDAFGRGKLHIKGAAAPNVDEDFNTAVKFLTMAIDMFRNEKNYTSNTKINDLQQAYEYLSLSSLAMRLLDRAEILS